MGEVFKVSLRIYLDEQVPYNRNDQDREQVIRNLILPFCDAMGLPYTCSNFYYHPDDESEVAGIDYIGFQIVAEREVKSKHHLFQLAKVFEGLAGVLKLMPSIARDVEFQLL